MSASAQRAAEPSMEEILASIRRIIADDKSRTPIGQARLVSVADTASEKPPADAGASHPQDVSAEPVQLPVSEAQTFGEGREVFSAPEAQRSAEPQARAPAPSPLASLAEEGASARSAPSVKAFGTGITSAEVLPSHANAFPMSRADNPTSAPEPPEGRSLPGESLTGDVVERAPASPLESERSDEWDADAALSRVFSPELESARRMQAEPDPELASPSPRLAQACAQDREARRPSALSASRLHPGTQEAPTMLSGEADRAVTRAFSDLNRGVLSENVRSLEDVVKEMLRPLLKAWLDDNLPRIVERLVRTEIERVARGRSE
ncbi:MAG: DUF2497 domain-containing protein [Hyphomicrobiales bacterium]|nr:DUF2497 domain-containing protein [Hyphomicrobiales bacterium]